MTFRELIHNALEKWRVVPMAFVFIAIIVGIVSLTIFKIIRKKKLPSKNFTPFDDITEGRTEE